MKFNKIRLVRARAFGVRSFIVWFSLLKCIKNDHKIQDLGAENLYII